MSETTGLAQSRVPSRLDWVDTAKGFCIILVVLMHVVVGFEVAQERESWIDPFIDWAKLFRMPGFFLLSGLFASRLIGKSWPDFLDRKVAPFVYFYLLWLAIHCLLKFQTWGQGDAATLFGSYTLGLVQPFGLLWFIYLLAVFFVVTKAARGYPVASWLIAAALATVPVTTGWLLVDRFAGYYVFFLSGALFAPTIFRFADWVRDHRAAALRLGLGWAAASAFLISLGGYEALHETFGADLVLGHAGALGIVALSVVLAGRLGWVAYCGRNSLPVYLGFFIPMALTRVLLIKAEMPFDVGAASLLLTVLCVALPLALHRLVRGTALAFLFERPRWFRLRSAGNDRAEPTEPMPVFEPEDGAASELNARAGR
ncbi:acyltransferase family protein [Bosea sp. (in: a-proteobacteria)]|uniref:acyltransferase family protein n=1 Tax=Bosea sp. (in: a-proteobacteria) TaxID=1871050 RepID=UPI002FCAAB33